MAPTADANARCKMHRRNDVMQYYNPSLLRCIPVRVEVRNRVGGAGDGLSRGHGGAAMGARWREKGKKEDELDVVPHRRASLLGLSDVPPAARELRRPQPGGGPPHDAELLGGQEERRRASTLSAPPPSDPRPPLPPACRAGRGRRGKPRASHRGPPRGGSHPQAAPRRPLCIWLPAT